MILNFVIHLLIVYTILFCLFFTVRTFGEAHESISFNGKIVEELNVIHLITSGAVSLVVYFLLKAIHISFPKIIFFEMETTDDTTIIFYGMLVILFVVYLAAAVYIFNLLSTVSKKNWTIVFIISSFIWLLYVDCYLSIWGIGNPSGGINKSLMPNLVMSLGVMLGYLYYKYFNLHSNHKTKGTYNKRDIDQLNRNNRF